MEKSNKKIEIVYKDDKGNILFEIRDGQCLISRFKNMDSSLKEKVIEIAMDHMDMEREEIIRFIEFNDNEQKFCS